jgi:hypothetical protein
MSDVPHALTTEHLWPVLFDALDGVVISSCR